MCPTIQIVDFWHILHWPYLQFIHFFSFKLKIIKKDPYLLSILYFQLKFSFDLVREFSASLQPALQMTMKLRMPTGTIVSCGRKTEQSKIK